MSHTYYDKQASSRPTLTTTTTGNMTKASAQTYQIRVAATAAGILTINDSSSTTTSVTQPVFVNIVAAAVGEYFTITPGQWYLPAANMFVTEMS